MDLRCTIKAHAVGFVSVFMGSSLATGDGFLAKIEFQTSTALRLCLPRMQPTLSRILMLEIH